jgi:hypothetical protein
LLCGQVFVKDISAKHAGDFHWKTMNVKNGKIQTLEGTDFERLEEDVKFNVKKFN